MEPLDVRDLLERHGSSREARLEAAVGGLATEVAAVPGPVRIDLLLESLVEGVLVSGPLFGVAAYTCARCLTEFPGEFRVEVTELFAPGAAAEDDEYPIVDGAIDLELMVRDAVLLSLPFSPLCRPDCRGLCERCGGNRNVGECTCPPESDPRWAGLKMLNLD